MVPKPGAAPAGGDSSGGSQTGAVLHSLRHCFGNLQLYTALLRGAALIQHRVKVAGRDRRDSRCGVGISDVPE